MRRQPHKRNKDDVEREARLQGMLDMFLSIIIVLMNLLSAALGFGPPLLMGWRGQVPMTPMTPRTPPGPPGPGPGGPPPPGGSAAGMPPGSSRT